MFKIICIKLQNKPNITCLEILIANNEPYYVNYNSHKIDLSSFLIPTNAYKLFQNHSRINLKNLLDFYGFNSKAIKPFRNYINMEIILSPALRLLMRKSKWFGNLIYAPTLPILESRWIECQKLETEFQNISFHKEFYELVKNRLIRDTGNHTNSSKTRKHSSKTRKHSSKTKRQTTKNRK
jgi:hypothetical protein